MILTINEINAIGQLGNHMFRVSSLIGLADRFGLQYSIPNWWAADMFNLDFELESNEFHTENYSPRNTLGFDTDLVEYITKNKKRPINLNFVNGYFQSYEYFHHIRDDIANMFNPSVYFEEGICAVNIRRGEYITKPDYHPLCSMEYYNTAMKHITSKTNVDKFRVFSDDIYWCRENFIGDQFEFFDSTDIHKQLIGLAQCEHIIMANSSFSWWGAYLNKNPDQIVIVPEKWFGPKYSHLDKRGLYAPGWEIL